MALSKAAAELLDSSGVKLGEGWASHIGKMNAGDEAQNIIIGDGTIPAKIDGYIHACTLAAKAIIGYSGEKGTGLDVVGVTSWNGGNSALRYAQWMVDFHWKIDTRTWQFMLYLYAMKWSFRDVIDNAKALDENERHELHKVNEDFWAEVVVAYTYRMEVIERSRGFAPHPDPTCGSSWQGYIYRKIWDRNDIPFQDLAIPLIEKGNPDYKPYAGKQEPRPFPSLADEVQIQPGLPRIALEWLRECKKRGLADSFLRVELGDRMVPTRFNGWWSSLEELLRFLKPFSRGEKAEMTGNLSDKSGHDLTDFAVRFAICHAYFQTNLKGNLDQLINLLKAVRVAVSAVWVKDGISAESVDRFIETAIAVISDLAKNPLEPDDEDLPELRVARPLHPRYAPVDPLEPLPWEVENLERYQRKMVRLGYTL